MLIRRLILFYLICICYTLTGQDYVLSNQTYFELLSIKDGLPDNGGNDFIQDPDGYIWIGNFGGLSKYDGYTFKTYKKKPDRKNQQSAGTHILCLYQDKDGFIWVGTLLSGLQRFNPKTETFTTYPYTTVGKPGVVDRYITDITGDSLGNIWVGTSNGLFHLTSPNGTFEPDDIALNHFSAKAYPDTLFEFFTAALKTEALLAGFSKVGKNQDKKAQFSLTESTRLVVSALGEYGGKEGMLDYGWITDAAGQIVWEMKKEDTYTAKCFDGRSDNPLNRATVQLLELAAGDYTLHYRTNEQHHYGDWNLIGIPEPYNMEEGHIPFYTTLWGIQVFKLEEAKEDWVEEILMLISPAETVSGSTVINLYLDKDKLLWVGSSGGLDIIDTKQSALQVQHLFSPVVNNGPSSSLNSVTCIYPSASGELLVYGHQLSYNDKNYQLAIESVSKEQNAITPFFQSTKHHHSGNILEDDNGNIWFTSYMQGLYKLVGTKDKKENYQLKEYNFVTKNSWHLFKDKSGVIWIGVWKEGIYKLTPAATNFRFIELPKKKDSYILSLAEDARDNIFIGTNNQGLFLWDKDRTTLKKVNLPKYIPTGTSIEDLCIDAQGILWILTEKKGILRYNQETDTFLESIPRTKDKAVFDPTITFRLKVTKNGDIWVSTTRGMYKYVYALDKFVFHKDISDSLIEGANMMLEDSKGKMWFTGMLIGLFNKYDKIENTGITTSVIDSFFISEPIYCIADKAENLWVGRSDGLHLINKQTGKEVAFKGKELIPKIRILNILPDQENNLWLSTTSGIGKFTSTTGDFVMYGTESGVYFNEQDYAPLLLTQSGNILYGGKNGLYSFNAADIQANPHTPQIKITKFVVETSSTTGDSSQLILLDKEQEIELDHNQNTFNIEYVGLLYDKAQQKRYAYRMLGLNDHWIKVNGERVARFNGLAPGNYTFQVKSSNGDGVWSESFAELNFQILAPWWKTTWAYSLYLLLFLGSIFAFYQNQIRRIKLVNQLTYEQKEAERLADIDRLKTNFFSNITHEFRTPLTLIIEPARQLMKKWQGHPDGKTVQLIESNSKQLLSLVNQLLDLSKLEGNKMKLDLRRGPIMETIAPIFNAFQANTARKEVNLELDIASNIPEFYYDKGKIEKVLYNLLSNATKFTYAGKIQLKIALQERPIPQLLLTVNDTGIGISKEQLPSIFDRFYQADSSNTRKGEGTGIGLALTKELIELMNGEIRVESELGQGSTFYCTLPMNLQGNEAALAKDTSLAGTPNIGANTSGPTSLLPASKKIVDSAESADKQLILLVEDNPELRQFLVQSLSDRYQIIEAENGAEGILKAKNEIPDLIVSDVMMPEKDGYELTAILKKDELTSHIPIILLTAKSAIDSKIQGLKRGADAWLTKPFHTEELLVRIENLIEIRAKLQKKIAHKIATKHKSTLTTEKELALIEEATTEEPTLELSEYDQAFLKKFTNHIEENLDESSLSVESVAEHLHVSRSQLHRKIKALTNFSPNAFIRNYRLDRAMELLLNHKGKISQIAYEVGFADEKYFSRRFKERFGKKPSEVTVLGGELRIN